MNVKSLFVALGLASVVMLPVAAQAGERASGVKLVSKSEMMRKTLPIKAKKRAGEGVSTAAIVAGGIVTTVAVVVVASDDNNSNQSAGASS